MKAGGCGHPGGPRQGAAGFSGSHSSAVLGKLRGGGVLENSTLLQCLKHQESYTYRPEAIDRISLNLWSWEMPTQGQVLSVGLKVGVGSFTKAWNVGKTSPVAFVRIP